MAISDHTLTIKLKQHTPIIHFQHDQAGATLRATEVKAKLDKFLISKLLGLDEGDLVKSKDQVLKTMQGQYPNWLIGGKKTKHLSLNYKIKIEAKNRDLSIKMPMASRKYKNDGTVEWSNSYPNFFGNMGVQNRANLKDLILHNDVKLTLFCLNTKLRKEIEERFPEFIATNNFGTRQSKGFGSYYLTDTKEYPLNENWFDYKTTIKCRSMKDLFEVIDLFYKALRGGINKKTFVYDEEGEKIMDTNGLPTQRSVFYFKSLLFLYFAKDGIQWEKKTIKECFYQQDATNRRGEKKYYGLNTQKDKWLNTEYSPLHFGSPQKNIIKPILGLSSQEQWFSYKDSIDIYEGEVVNGKVTKKRKGNIERFKSPVLFKPVIGKDNSWTIYIKLNKTNPLSGKLFVIESNRSRKQCNPLSLKVPANFSLSSFFESITDKGEFNITNHVAPGFHSRYEYKRILKPIFENLKKIN